MATNRFELTREYLDNLKTGIQNQDEMLVKQLTNELHPADIAEIFDELDIEEARFVYLHLDPDKGADLLIELEEDVRERFLSFLTSAEIASVFIDNMDSDDAADIIAELPEAKQDEVLSHIRDVEQAGDIVDLLSYDEDTAGGLMATELIAVQDDWTVSTCLDEIRKQAEEVDEIFFVYVVNASGVLKGTLPLKKLLLANVKTLVKNIYDTSVISVKTDTDSEEVASIMEKYDLVALPVVDSIGRLKGRITIDDVVDVIKEEAEKDYQMISGISGDVEASDSIFQLTKARIPWLFIGLIGGVLGALVIGGFEEQIKMFPEVAFFITLITAMGGNAGIQSSSIIVQGLANKSLGFDSTGRKLFKEISIALLNGTILSTLLFAYNLLMHHSMALTVSVSLALISIIVFASLFGTFVPLALNRLKIDPAVATGPFITTTNDVIGLFVYFMISRFFYLQFI
ncbi:MAG: magnesium transporter [Bacteroidetes bacterium HGW-Bacteroidetes-4]|jgi:magnesium transporter|nr:MAG: magnesium transporter [Bacteroidetes bacterium HGW-Bacteroidetes-4]